MPTRKGETPKRAAQSRQGEDKPKVGRPSKLAPDIIKQARKLCERGFTDQEIADFFEVDRSTIYRWKHDSAEFCDALRLGKEAPDDRVTRSLFASAIGYEHNEIDIRVVNGEIVQTPIRKFYPPNAVACIYWLKNRRPDLWRDKAPENTGGDKADLLKHLADGLPD